MNNVEAVSDNNGKFWEDLAVGSTVVLGSAAHGSPDQLMSYGLGYLQSLKLQNLIACLPLIRSCRPHDSARTHTGDVVDDFLCCWQREILERP
jgi:hypothetical protein